MLRAAAETPTDEGGAEAASAAPSRGRPSAKFSIHAQGTKWIAVRLDRPRKYDSMVESLLKKLRFRQGWTLLPYGSEGVASDDDDSGAACSTLAAAPAPGPATKRAAAASSQGQVAASAAEAAVAASAAGRMPQRALALKLGRIVGADAPKKKCRWSLDGDVLSKGSFGEVRLCQHPGEGAVAVKLFTGRPELHNLDALREVTALVAIPEHENILRLLDVGTDFDKAVLVYPLFSEGPLSLWTQTCPRKPRMSAEGRYRVAVSLMRAVAHLHCHGILHTDVKPQNILVGLPGGSRDGSGAPRARLRSKVSWNVVLADFGSSVPTQPQHRWEEKRPPTTFWYRSPELLFGDVGYGEGVDSWACACTLLELACAEPMWPRLGQDSFSFQLAGSTLPSRPPGGMGGGLGLPFPSRPPGGAPGNAARKSQAHTRWVATQVDLIFEIFKTFGLPSSDGLLVQLPNYPAQPPKFVVGKDDWRRKFPLEEPEKEEEFLAMLSGFFELEPGARATPTQAMSGGCFSYLTPDLRCRTLACEAPAGRGPFSLVQGAVGRRTLSWLQSDPYWAELPQKVGAPKTHKVCHAASENEVKHEEGGYTRTQAPSTKLCSRIDCSAPCPAVRVGAFARALVACNHGWLVQLTQEVRSELRKFPPAFLKENGERFMTSCFSDTIFAYAILQVMKPGEARSGAPRQGRLALARWTDDIRQTGLGVADSGGG